MENKNNSLIQIYGDYLSQPVRSIVAFCKINNIPFEFKFVNLGKGEQYTEEYKKINSFGKIPAIVIKNSKGEEFKLAESCTILRFLSEHFSVDNKWYPKDNIFRKAMIDQWMDWHHLNTRYALSNFVFGKVFLKKLQSMGINRQVNDTQETVGKVLHFLNKILGTRKYVVDDEISIADLVLACEIYQLILTDYDLSKFKNVVEFLKRINSIDSMKQVNQIFEEIATKLKINLNKSKF